MNKPILNRVSLTIPNQPECEHKKSIKIIVFDTFVLWLLSRRKDHRVVGKGYWLRKNHVVMYATNEGA